MVLHSQSEQAIRLSQVMPTWLTYVMEDNEAGNVTPKLLHAAAKATDLS